ncbi:MAG: TetR/AcrR family transcriptional regulator [Phenylobacterium sp.]|nr:TetR/AcrR family transcriptional regulator [Phenylobacterium sp.]
MSRRTQQERRETTHAALIAAARKCFGELGYEATFVGAVAAQAGVTTGAFYHHFPQGKPQLFEAVVMAELARLSAVIAAPPRGAGDGLAARLEAYFDIAVEPIVYRITLEDAPAVLGLKRWREIEYAHTTRLIEADLARPGAAGGLPPRMLAAAIYGACCEATILIVEADDKAGAKRDAVQVVLALLTGVRR